jgi:hypothetical protein
VGESGLESSSFLTPVSDITPTLALLILSLPTDPPVYSTSVDACAEDPLEVCAEDDPPVKRTSIDACAEDCLEVCAEDDPPANSISADACAEDRLEVCAEEDSISVDACAEDRLEVCAEEDLDRRREGETSGVKGKGEEEMQG